MVGSRTDPLRRWGSAKRRRTGPVAGYGLVVPVEFLTDEQAEAYGRFAEEPTRPELERFFFLDDVDRDLIALRRTLYDHAWEIRDAYGYHPYEDAEGGRRFRTFLHGRAWTHAEGPVALFNQAVGWLRRHRVLLPGVTVLLDDEDDDGGQE